MSSILVVGNDKDLNLILTRFLSKVDFLVNIAHNGKAAINLVRNNSYEIILCDMALPDLTGIEMLRKIKIIDPSVPVIIITGHFDLRTAVEAFRFGAVDYLAKPLSPDILLATIRKSIGNEEVLQKNDELPKVKKVQKSNQSLAKSDSLPKFFTSNSTSSRAVQHNIEIVSPSDMSVIIIGETGTGKEFAAQSIHACSKRANGVFMAIDCGALPKELAGSELFGHVRGSFTGAINDKPGSFELADGGTIFLDEIGNLTYENQVKLLRVIQERKIKRIGATRDIAIDVRIITATNENLTKAVKEGRLREDLYHRLNEFKIQLLPLRERKEDILPFSDFFLQQANLALDKNILSFSIDARKYLFNYSWYGNLRELNNVIRRAVLLSTTDQIESENLPSELTETNTIFYDEEMGDKGVLKSIARTAERQAIMEVLEKVNYNKSKASEALTIDRKTLYNKLKLYSIKG